MIDLQKGIAQGGNYAPYSAESVLENNARIAKKLKNTDALIVCVHVKNHGGETLHPIADTSNPVRISVPNDFSDFLLPIANDKNAQNVIHIAKHNWGAFYGTDLDVQLRRRGIDTILLTGIATTIGVDTTAREAYQGAYNIIAVEDAMTDITDNDGTYHKETVEKTFKRIARVRSTDEVLEML